MMLRVATNTDLDAIIDLYVTGWQHSYVGTVDQNFLATMGSNPRSRDYLASLLSAERTDAVVLLAEEENTPAGFIAAGMSRDVMDRDLAEIYAIYIAAAHQKKRLGRRLFDVCCKHLRQRGFKRLRVWTFTANENAQSAYKRWGGTLSDATRMVAIGGDHLEEVSFDWDLAATG